MTYSISTHPIKTVNIGTYSISKDPRTHTSSDDGMSKGKLTLKDIPPEIIAHTIALSGKSPFRTRLVSKDWHEPCIASYREMIEKYNRHPGLSRIINSILLLPKFKKDKLPSEPDITLSTINAEQSMQVINLLRKAVLARADAIGVPVIDPEEVHLEKLLDTVDKKNSSSFISFFNRVCDGLEIERPVFEGTDLEQANAMRVWMNANRGLLSTITRLNLSGLGLRVLPPEISLFTALQVLDLGENKLSRLPSQIVQLVHLEKLNLGCNAFTRFPIQLTQLRALITLSLFDNEISTIPDEIHQMDALRSIYLDHNRFTYFPTQLTQVRNLRNIYLTHNKINVCTIPNAIFRQLHRSAGVYLDHNPF